MKRLLGNLALEFISFEHIQGMFGLAMVCGFGGFRVEGLGRSEFRLHGKGFWVCGGGLCGFKAFRASRV